MGLVPNLGAVAKVGEAASGVAEPPPGSTHPFRWVRQPPNYNVSPLLRGLRYALFACGAVYAYWKHKRVLRHHRAVRYHEAERMQFNKLLKKRQDAINSKQEMIKLAKILSLDISQDQIDGLDKIIADASVKPMGH